MTDYRDILQKYWGYPDFRGVQREIIESVGQGKDTLGLMPTGGGKSITFQVPTLAHEGLCLVITPLVALMKDQVANLKKRGIKAAAIYAGMTRQETIVTLENCIFGNFKFLYVSPERLSNELFLTKITHIPVSLITVDEAHCISQWGYDFRPSYLKIAEIRKLLPNIPVLALTATATPDVVKDIQQKLEFKEENVFQMSFRRENLTYVVREADNKYEEMMHILQHVPGCSIVYTRNRERTKKVAEILEANQVKAVFFHAGLSNTEKDARQKAWQNDEVRVMVATNAFGMGIDKPNVRTVIHIDTPDSIEAYFQEAGRAGRDGQRAYAVLIHNKKDNTQLAKRVNETFPDKDFIRTIYEQVCFYFQMAVGDGYNVSKLFNLEKFCQLYKHFPVVTSNALHILNRTGLIYYTEEEDTVSRIMFTVKRSELYQDNLEENDDKVVRAILRFYGGIFSEYIPIQEEKLAQVTALTMHQVYESLLNLTRQHILHYVPRRRSPLITFKTRRVETEDVPLTPDIYDNRKRIYQERIDAMLNYCNNTTRCRSQVLIDYLGEKDSEPCCQCDVCLQQTNNELKQGELELISQRIVQLLSNGKTHFVNDLSTVHHSMPKVQLVLKHLLSENIIQLQNGVLSLLETDPQPSSFKENEENKPETENLHNQ